MEQLFSFVQLLQPPGSLSPRPNPTLTSKSSEIRIAKEDGSGWNPWGRRGTERLPAPFLFPCVPGGLGRRVLSPQASFPRSTSSELYRRWARYRAQCQDALAAAEPSPELACNGTFDMYACWPHSPPNTTASTPCPWYLPWHQEVTTGYVLRLCEADGQWGPWRDHSQCAAPEEEQVFQVRSLRVGGSPALSWGEENSLSHGEMRCVLFVSSFIQDQRLILEKLQLVYTVGYALSLAALLLALLILGSFRKLRCTRNYIHMNLFISFIFRAAAILTRDKLLPPLGLHIGEPSQVLPGQSLAACRVAQVVTQYCVSANHTWLLVEGVYLYSLLVLMAFSEDSHFKCYLFLGWGGPALFVVPWVISRHLYENTQCWERNEIKAIWWIIRTPILATILVNFLIFIRILGILLAKLKAHQMRCQDYRLRLARSTLTLVPLLGIHEVVFAPVTEEQAEGALRYTKLYFEIFLSSFQGLFVSILYCFINKEVQAEIRKQWQRCQLGQILLDEQHLSQDRRRAPGGEGEEASPASESSC
ncbi:gastric inhibitory polypeptide receptor [Antechinus flavipes]|uniref:gastric inhibitory polypeptide receptor n=1 Tax=Antechinus flavipes TaxID=38775 RepID=UPI002236A1E4|nr:gastric inhibitory polypeptide receptor [Antechinus flavipes]